MKKRVLKKWIQNILLLILFIGVMANDFNNILVMFIYCIILILDILILNKYGRF